MSLGFLRRGTLLLLCLATYALGPSALIFAVPIAFVVVALPGEGALCLLALTASRVLQPHWQSIPPLQPLLSIHAGSVGFLLLPSVVVLLTFFEAIRWRGVLILLGSISGCLFAINLTLDLWLSAAELSSETFRTLAALAPSILLWIGTKGQFLSGSRLAGSRLLVFAPLGILLSFFPPRSPIATIVFDESHGDWETVDASFGPESFGRGVNYTYSLLFDYAKELTGRAETFEKESSALPEKDSVFVLKLPSKPLSADFVASLEQWVSEGGRLLVIADHTDLYDHAQILNSALQKAFKFKINTDAVFDRKGMPNIPSVGYADAVFGNVHAREKVLPWQTGASFSEIPTWSIELANFGLSFSEPGDYSASNRFGNFSPRPNLRLMNHSAMIGFPHGSGVVTVLLDSTPWSNFALFKEQYRHLFKSTLYVLEKPYLVMLASVAAPMLLLLALLLPVVKGNAILGLSGLVLGCVLGATAQLGAVSFMPIEKDLNNRLAVYLGDTARTEFLTQILWPGDENFTRIISALAKYGLVPITDKDKEFRGHLTESNKILFIRPNVDLLPANHQIFDHLRAGRDFSVIFAPADARNPVVRNWLESLGLILASTRALAVAEDARPGQSGLLNRRGPSLIRDIRVATRATPASLLKELQTDQLIQSYLIRPTRFPRVSGILNVSFSSDQFSDGAIGDIWEGANASSIGKLREKQIAAALLGKPLPDPFPTSLKLPAQKSAQSGLASYALIEDGVRTLKGRFDQSAYVESTVSPTPLRHPVRYLLALRDQAQAMISRNCPKKDQITQCESRLLGSDAVEWMVSWRADADGNLSAVELLHERSFSGLGKTVNVLFWKD